MGAYCSECDELVVCSNLRTFFSTSIPSALIESAKIDGAKEYTILFKVLRCHCRELPLLHCSLR